MVHHDIIVEFVVSLRHFFSGGATEKLLVQFYIQLHLCTHLTYNDFHEITRRERCYLLCVWRSIHHALLIVERWIRS